MKLNTIHVCMFEPSKASRVQMQINWDNKALVLWRTKTKIIKPDNSDKTVYKTLKLSNLFKILINKKTVTCVFHEQATLPYLLIVYLWKKISFSNINIIYDMHDLNEESFDFNYSYFRYLVMYSLEYFVVKAGIKIITVSNGLCCEMRKRYGKACDIRVVYNIPQQRINKIRDDTQPNILYFGQIDDHRVSLKIMKKFLLSGMILHLHGIINERNSEYLEFLKESIDAGVIVYNGEYNSSDLNFLTRYMFSLIDYSEVKTKNIQYCLPNKLFQSLRYGLICLISHNLSEIAELFSDYPFNVVIIPNSDDKINNLCESLCRYYNKLSMDDINNYIDILEDNSKKEFLSAINNC